MQFQNGTATERASYVIHQVTQGVQRRSGVRVPLSVGVPEGVGEDPATVELQGPAVLVDGVGDHCRPAVDPAPQHLGHGVGVDARVVAQQVGQGDQGELEAGQARVLHRRPGQDGTSLFGAYVKGEFGLFLQDVTYIPIRSR
ncbi:hypothetical protein [Streptomyces broussonetiae]|uniref:hypothetical protein n=1 Tax=Streptomyces broussonetiae TaxID=2686304 RepID=UPI0035E3234D